MTEFCLLILTAVVSILAYATDSRFKTIEKAHNDAIHATAEWMKEQEIINREFSKEIEKKVQA